MKRTLLLLAALLSATVALAQPKIVSHRGFHDQNVSENSLDALTRAHKIGSWGSEFDVWMTSDGVLVVNHDPRFPGDSRKIAVTPFAEFKDLRLPDGQRISTLEEYLNQGRKCGGMKLVLEIKDHKDSLRNREVADAVVTMVRNKRLSDRTVFISFAYDVCRRIVEVMPDAKVQPLDPKVEPEQVAADGMAGIDCYGGLYRKKADWIARAHAAGLEVNVWTIDDPEEMRYFVEQGVDYITTNRPDILKSLLKDGSEAPAAMDPTVRDWAQTDRYLSDNAAQKVRPKAVLMGDSITYGWLRHYPEALSEDGLVCRGISGQTTCQMLVRFRQDVIDLHPRYVVILAGTNDIALNLGEMREDTTMDNIISMCELARANRITPVLCSVTPSDGFGWRAQLKPQAAILSLNARIKAYAASKGYRYVDFHAAMVDPQTGGVKAGLTSDGTHPVRDCYENVMLPLILKALK